MKEPIKNTDVDNCRLINDIDLVLMEIRMLDMNGFEASIRIPQINNKLAIIAQTAIEIISRREKAKKVGCNDSILKPVNCKILISLMLIHNN